MKKSIICLLFVLLIGCGSGGKSSTKPIQYWTFFSGADGEVMTELVNEYNEEYPENAVESIMIDWGSFYTKLSTTYLGGQPPDIATAHSHMLSSILTYGDLANIDTISTNFDWAQFPETTVNNITVGGKHIAIPYDTHGFIMYYNPNLVSGTSLVDSNGEWIADTWEKLETGLQEVSIKYPDIKPLSMNNTDAATLWLWYSLYKQLGGNKFATEDGYFDVDIEPAKKALDSLKSVFDKGYALRDHATTFDFLRDGKVAVAFDGSWIAQAVRDKQPDMKAIPIPPFFGKDLAWGTSHVFILPEGDKVDIERQKKTLHFAQWLVDNSNKWANLGLIPAKIEIQESEEYQNNPNSTFRALSTQVAVWPESKYLDILTGGDVLSHIEQYLNGEIDDISEMVEKINEQLSYKI